MTQNLVDRIFQLFIYLFIYEILLEYLQCSRFWRYHDKKKSRLWLLSSSPPLKLCKKAIFVLCFNIMCKHQAFNKSVVLSLQLHLRLNFPPFLPFSWFLYSPLLSVTSLPLMPFRQKHWFYHSPFSWAWEAALLSLLTHKFFLTTPLAQQPLVHWKSCHLTLPLFSHQIHTAAVPYPMWSK